MLLISNLWLHQIKIYNLVPYEEKNKINFLHINKLDEEYKNKNKQKFDIAFVDGNHSDYNIIMNDFNNSLSMTTDNGIIIFDDYGNFPVVTRVVDDVIKKYTNFKFVFIPFRGHLFMKDKKCDKSFEVVLFKNPEYISRLNII